MFFEHAKQERSGAAMPLQADTGALQGTGPRHLGPHLLLAFVLLVGAVVRAWCFVGVGTNDDLGYVHVARALSDGFAILGTQLGHRVALVVPLAALYRLFGMHEWALICYPLVCSLLSGVFIFQTARMLWGPSIGLIAGLFWATYPADVVFATQIIPGTFMAACVSISLYWYFHGYRGGRSGASGGALFLSGCFFSLGWLYNERMLVFVPAGLLLLLLNRPSIRQAAWIGAGLATPVMLDFLLSWSLTEGVFTRLESIVRTEQIITEDNKRPEYLWRAAFRVFPIDPLNDEGHFGVMWYLSGLAALYGAAARQRVVFSLSAGAFLVLAYYQWGIQDLQGTPITKWVRYLVPTIPLQCLAISGAIAHLISRSAAFGGLLGMGCGLLVCMNALTAQHVGSIVRIRTQDFRELARYLHSTAHGRAVYLDDYSLQMVDLFSGGRLDLQCLERMDGRARPSSGLLIANGSRAVIERPGYGEKFPAWYGEVIQAEEPVAEIRGSKVGVYGEFDPAVYVLGAR